MEDDVIVPGVCVLLGLDAGGAVAGAAEVGEMRRGRVDGVDGQGSVRVPAGVDGEGHGFFFVVSLMLISGFWFDFGFVFFWIGKNLRGVFVLVGSLKKWEDH